MVERITKMHLFGYIMQEDNVTKWPLPISAHALPGDGTGGEDGEGENRILS